MISLECNVLSSADRGAYNATIIVQGADPFSGHAHYTNYTFLLRVILGAPVQSDVAISAIAGWKSLNFTFGPIADDGGSPLRDVRIGCLLGATWSPSGFAFPFIILTRPGQYKKQEGLVNGQVYTCRANAINSIGQTGYQPGSEISFTPRMHQLACFAHEDRLSHPHHDPYCCAA